MRTEGDALERTQSIQPEQFGPTSSLACACARACGWRGQRRGMGDGCKTRTSPGTCTILIFGIYNFRSEKREKPPQK